MTDPWWVAAIVTPLVSGLLTGIAVLCRTMIKERNHFITYLEVQNKRNDARHEKAIEVLAEHASAFREMRESLKDVSESNRLLIKEMEVYRRVARVCPLDEPVRRGTLHAEA